MWFPVRSQMDYSVCVFFPFPCFTLFSFRLPTVCFGCGQLGVPRHVLRWTGWEQGWNPHSRCGTCSISGNAEVRILLCVNSAWALPSAGFERLFQTNAVILKHSAASSILSNLFSANPSRQMKWISEMESIFVYLHFAHRWITSYPFFIYLLAVPEIHFLCPCYSRWQTDM